MSLNKALRYTILSGLFLIPFVALLVSTSLYFPYITGKNFLFRALVEIIFVCYAALAFRDPQYRPRWKSSIVISLSIFVVILFLADIFGEHFYKSFWSNFERMEGFITFLHLFALFFISTVMLNTETLWRRLFHTSFAVGIIMGFIGLYQHFHNHIDRIDAQLGNSTYLGALMLFNIFLLLFYLMRTIRERRPPWIYAAVGYTLAIIFDAYILFLTGTRGAFLGVLAGLFFIALMFAFFEREQKAVKYAGVTLLLLGVLGIGFLAVFRNSDLVKNNVLLSRFSAPVNAVLTLDIKKFAETEGKGRLLIWQAALKGVAERPVLGWGQENFNYIFNKYYDPQMYDQEQWFDRSHNVFLDWLTQAGVLGLLSYLSLFGLLIFGIWKKGSNNFSLEDRAILTGLLIAYFIHNFFVFDNITSYIFFFFLLAYVNRNRQDSTIEKKKMNINPDIADYALTPIAFIVVATAFYFSVLTPYFASAKLINALTTQQASANNPQALQTSFEDYQKAISYNSFGNPEIREQLLQFLPLAVSSGADDKTKQAIISFGRTEMEQELKEAPTDARYFLFYGYTLDHFGDYSEANLYLERAHQLSPHKQTIAFELGLNYIDQKNFNQGLSILKEAYDSAPEYQDAKISYAMGLIYTGKDAEADALLKTADPVVLGDSRLLRAYYDTKQYQKVIDIYHLAIKRDPNNVQNYLGATAFEMATNQKLAAVAELQKVVDLFSTLNDPNASNVVLAAKSYIDQIKAGKNPLPIK